MLAAATSLFARTNISQCYVISSPGATPSSSALPAANFTPAFNVGPWKVQFAMHKTTNKRVSVWSFDKRSPELERCGPSARERVLDVLKVEAGALGRLRHPSILEMVEPLEETRSELTFATEPLLSSLSQSIPSASRSPSIELDEVEIQKGILQLCKGLDFLHTSARLIHSNISPSNVLINANGDWKISGLGLTIALTTPDGSPTRWEFPTYDSRLTPHVQRSFDYMAPEYALDEQLTTASDMYALGCLIYAVHCKGKPPFSNHGSVSGLRDNAGKPATGTEHLDADLRALLSSLITRQPQGRPSPTTLPTYPFFSSLPVSTLSFLDRSTFASKTREEKIAFMKGLSGVLPRFSDGLRTRKILPSLLEEMKDTHLLPSILPNVFLISKTLSPAQFATIVLPSLKPMFAIKEPPQNMLTLLDNLTLLQEKTDKATFKEHVLSLVYNALESEHAIVQERALKTVPDLCETIDYAEVQSVLFPRVALVFTKTRILSVKVSTLACFLSMVKTLDQSSLTQKLVPLLSKIRTRLGTLAVQEAMGMKVDREAVATLVLPQLWAMSMGPLINVDQFQRFMNVIRNLGTRVEKEHMQYLKDSQRLEDRSGGVGESGSTPAHGSTGVDFESLVGGASSANTKSTTLDSGSQGWDDVWGSILADTPVQSPTPVNGAKPSLASAMLSNQSYSLPSSPAPFVVPSSTLLPTSSVRSREAKLSSSTFSFPSPPQTSYPIFSSPMTSNESVTKPQFNIRGPPLRGPPLSGPPLSGPPLSGPPLSSPPLNGPLSGPPLFPAQPTPSPQHSQLKPNYNIQLPPAKPASSSTPTVPFNSILAPSTPAKPTWRSSNSAQNHGKDAWGDFDPLG
ncbi:kinase-like domain-containing protein [Gautieria morchelliformis]|nr:kinase-like domain-containing protein [Gautieria morchelliformis]